MPRYVLAPDAALQVVGRDAVPAATLLAPTLLRSEVLERLCRAVRSGGIGASDGEARRQRFDRLKARDPGDRALRRTAWRIAEDEAGPPEYVALTQLRADALVTGDAALTSGRVDVRPLSVLS